MAAVIAGNFLYALMVNYLTGIPISGFEFIFNVIMLAVGYKALRKAFASTTLASTWGTLTEDILLCKLFSGLGIGIPLGIVIRYE